MTRWVKYLPALFFLLCFAESASAQGSFFTGNAWRYTPSGIFAASGATVTVCTSAGTGQPCTPKISLFADAALIVPVANPLPVCTSAPQFGCIDGLGNYSFYAGTPGPYTYTITGAGLTAYGPIPTYSSLTLGANIVLTVADITQNSAATHFGDSVTQCVGLGSGPNAPSLSTQCYWSILDTAKVWSSTNSGVSGSGITDVGQMDSILGTTVAATSVSTELCCVNDMRNNGAGGIVGGAQQIDWASSLEAALLWLAIPDAGKVKASGGSVVYAGSWTTPAQSYGGLTRQTTSAANTASFSVYGTSVYVVSLWQVGNTSTYTVTIDGVVQPTISTVTGSYTTIQSRAFGPLTTRFSGLSEITHTVVLTCTAADVSNPCYFVFAAGGSGQSAKSGPYVFAGNTLRFTSAGYAGSGGSEAIVGQFNQRTQQVVNDLASDGLHVQLVDVSGYYTPSGTNTQTDGVHPTIVGHGVLAAAFQKEMIGYLTPNDRASLRMLQNVNICTSLNASGSGLFIGGCPQNGIGTRGDLGTAESATLARLFLGLDGAGIQRSGGNYLFTAAGLSLFQFNGTTSSFPAFKFAGAPAKITSRAADDSADALLQGSQLISTVAIGTPPVVVTSTTAVPNLTVQNCSNCVLAGTPSGAGIATLTLKKGTGGGNYTTASTTFVHVGAGELCNTVTIPTGWKLGVTVSASLATATAAVTANLALSDNAACATDNAGILQDSGALGPATAASAFESVSLNWTITGDGASHNIALQFKTSAGADVATLLNASATQLPTMNFSLMPSN